MRVRAHLQVDLSAGRASLAASTLWSGLNSYVRLPSAPWLEFWSLRSGKSWLPMLQTVIPQPGHRLCSCAAPPVKLIASLLNLGLCRVKRLAVSREVVSRPPGASLIVLIRSRKGIGPSARGDLGRACSPLPLPHLKDVHARYFPQSHTDPKKTYRAPPAVLYILASAAGGGSPAQKSTPRWDLVARGPAPLVPTRLSPLI